MKKTIVRSLLALTLTGGIAFSCGKNFLEQPPLGTLSENILKDRRGVEALLIGAYSMLDGSEGGTTWAASPTNWVYGSICGGDAYKGSDAGDQSDVNSIERHEHQATNPYFRDKFVFVYDGIARSNDVLRFLKEATDVTDAERKRIEGEARFLRGHYHSEAAKMWRNAPFIDENVTDFRVPNDREIWTLIEADFKYAYDNLPETHPQVGRANKWAAGSYLAKTLMFQKKYAEAKALFDVIIASGQTTSGKKYALTARYHDNFRTATENNEESVFAIQYSVGGAGNARGGAGEVLNYPHQGGPGRCCGFFQPSQSLVNSFRVDNNGLPLIDTFNEQDVANDQGIRSNEPFTPHTGPLDPRLDWTVGRRGIPYLDWGNHPGFNWIRDQSYAGPYSPIKNVYYQAEEGTLAATGAWGEYFKANNYVLIRFADVLLMAAEAEVEAGSLDRARQLVNQVRRRAANPDGFVKRADRKSVV